MSLSQTGFKGFDFKPDLKDIHDPELGLDIWTLGLVYGVDIQGSHLKITMTFTTPMCPYGPMLLQEVREAGVNLGFDSVEVEITFEPLWKPTEEVKMLLGIA